MENVYPRIGEGAQKLLQLIRRLRQFRFEVLLLPLREAQDHRKIVAYFSTYRLHNLNGESRAIFKRASVLIISLIGACPEEVIDQIAMRSV